MRVGPRALLLPLALCGVAAAQAGTSTAADASQPFGTFRLLGAATTVSRGEVALEMAFHLRRQDDGRAACTQLVKTVLVRRAAAKAGVWPDPATVQSRWAELRRQLAAVGRDVANETMVRNCGEAALLDYLAVDLAHEQLVRRELSLRQDEQVAPAMLELWVKEARERAHVVDDPDRLPVGVAARVDDQDVPMLDLGLLLLRSSDQDELDKFLRQVVVLQTLEAMARQHDIAVSADDLQREIAARRAQADRDPRFRGLSYEQLLRANGVTPDTLLQSRVFRGHVLQRKLVALLHPRAELLAQIASDRNVAQETYGPRLHLGVIFVRALDEPNALVPRDFTAAMRHLEDVRARLAKESFDTVAKIESDDPATKLRGGDAGWLNRRSSSLPEAVAAAAWNTELGTVSAPIRGADGCYLVKVFAVEPELDDDALIERMREHLVEKLTRDILEAAAIARADGSVLPTAPAVEAGK